MTFLVFDFPVSDSRGVKCGALYSRLANGLIRKQLKSSDLYCWQFNRSAPSITVNSIRQIRFSAAFSAQNCPNEAGKGVTRLCIGTQRAKQQDHRKFPSIM